MEVGGPSAFGYVSRFAFESFLPMSTRGCVLLTKVPRNPLRSPRNVRRTEVGYQRVHTSNLGLRFMRGFNVCNTQLGVGKVHIAVRVRAYYAYELTF